MLVGAALVPTSAAAVAPCPDGEPCVVVHSPNLPGGSAVVTREDLNAGADLSSTTYQIRKPDGHVVSDVSSPRTVSVRALLGLSVLPWQGGDPIGAVTYTEAPHRNSTPSLLFHDDLLAPGTAGYPFEGPPPALYVAADAHVIQYVRSASGPADVNGYDYWQSDEDGPLDLYVHTSGSPSLQPVLTADKTSVPSGGPVTFTVAVQRRPSTPLSYRWTFGDGATTTTSDPTTRTAHTYPTQGGTYLGRVEVLTGTDVVGRSNAVSIRVGTPPRPTPSATPRPGSGTTPHTSTATGPRDSDGHVGGAAPSPTAGAGSSPQSQAPGGSVDGPGRTASSATGPVQRPPVSPSASPSARPSASPSARPSPEASPAPTRRAQPAPSSARALPVVQGELISSSGDVRASQQAGAATSATAPPAQQQALSSRRSVPVAVLVVGLLLAAGAMGESGLPIRRAWLRRRR